MNLTEPDKSDLLSLFDYVGKKFKHYEDIAPNWGLEINETLDFPVGYLYAKDYDQAGTEYWFYDGVLSYGVYVWYLLGAVCSGITIKKGKHTDESNTFFLEEKPEELLQKSSACSGLFAPILDLSMKDFETEADLAKEASRLLEGFALFVDAKEHAYSFALDESFFPNSIADKSKINFEIWQDKIDEIYLVITDEAESRARKAWEEETITLPNN